VVDDIVKLDYAASQQQLRRPFVGRASVGITLLAAVVGMVGFIFGIDACALPSYGLGLFGFALSLLSLSRSSTRAGAGWKSFWLSLAYWFSVIIVEGIILGNLGG
jgi:hypothetical protein